MKSILSIYRILKRTGKKRREEGEGIQKDSSPYSSHNIKSWAAVRYVQETQPLVCEDYEEHCSECGQVKP